MSRTAHRVLDRIQTDDELLASILRDHPELTRQKALEVAAAFGFDLHVSSTGLDGKPDPNRWQ